MNNSFLALILALSFIVVIAKGAGYVSMRLGQPSVLGELIAGLILGPTALNMLHTWPVFASQEGLGETIRMLAELGVVFLMMLAGLDLNIGDLLRAGKVSALAGTIGAVLPLIVGWAVSVSFGADNSEALFIGLALAATSVSISAQTLMEMNMLRTPVGLALLGAAVFDDILALLMLSIAVVAVLGVAGGMGGVALTIALLLAYLVGASLLGLWVIPSVVIYTSRLPISQGLIAVSIVICLLFAWSAEVVGGMAAITGAFLAGLFLARTPFKQRIEGGISVLAYGFFVPIFFVNIGLEANMRGISGSQWWFALAITLVAIVTKVIGCGAGGLMAGFGRLDALRLGIGMVSRGEVGLIIAAFALGQGVLSQAGFSVVVFMVVVATLVTPPLLRIVYANSEPSRAGEALPAEAID